jgi:small subunit ribosomal protein S18
VTRASAPPRRAAKAAARRPVKPKVCGFCRDHVDGVDYKDVDLLRRFISDRGKLRVRRASGTCARHQRDVVVAVKTARELALLPYAERTPLERGGGRGRAGGRGRPDVTSPALATSPDVTQADRTQPLEAS